MSGGLSRGGGGGGAPRPVAKSGGGEHATMRRCSSGLLPLRARPPWRSLSSATRARSAQRRNAGVRHRRDDVPAFGGVRVSRSRADWRRRERQLPAQARRISFNVRGAARAAQRRRCRSFRCISGRARLSRLRFGGGGGEGARAGRGREGARGGLRFKRRIISEHVAQLAEARSAPREAARRGSGAGVPPDENARGRVRARDGRRESPRRRRARRRGRPARSMRRRSVAARTCRSAGRAMSGAIAGWNAAGDLKVALLRRRSTPARRRRRRRRRQLAARLRRAARRARAAASPRRRRAATAERIAGALKTHPLGAQRAGRRDDSARVRQGGGRERGGAMALAGRAGRRRDRRAGPACARPPLVPSQPGRRRPRAPARGPDERD